MLNYLTKLFSNKYNWESDDFHNARNSTNEEELMQLSLHNDPMVRLQVAQNTATPLEVLMNMVDDRNHKVSLYAYYRSVNSIKENCILSNVPVNEVSYQEPLCDI